MRILQLAPLWESVPPSRYGGTESVISVLTHELVGRGIDVTLWASGDSRSIAPVRWVYPNSLRTADHLADRSPYVWTHVAAALQEAGDYDLIHNHAGELAMAMGGLVGVPMLTTMHCSITPDTRFVWDRYQGWYNTISYAQRGSMPAITGGVHAGVIHNAIDAKSYPFSNDKDDYLLYLSRISPEKGPHLAIEVARRLGRKLIIAAKIDHPDRQFYRDTIEPLIDGERVIYAGEADAAQKRELYRRASCLLLPLCWEEPFGLVMAEAMACGTPVIAFARGSAPELIVDGETGFLVDDVDGMMDAVRRLDRIDPGRCRRHIEERFSPELMADRYCVLYQRILDEVARKRRPIVLPSPAAQASIGTNGNGAQAIA